MQFPGQGKPPLGIIYDSDFGNRIDDALALALLYGFDGKGQARVVSMSVTKSNLKAAAMCEVVGRFYGGAVSGAIFAIGRTLPLGMATDGRMAEDTPMITVPLERKNASGAPVYNHGINRLEDTAEVPALIRNAFTSQYDQNCAVVLAGPATNLASVLPLPGVKDLIKAKVRYLVVSGGAFPEGEPEFNIKQDVAAARKLFAEWPTPVFFAGREVGEPIPFPGASIEKDFAWATDHPVVDAYRAYKPMPYDAPSWDMIAVLQAVKPDDGYFKLSEPGTVTVAGDGRTRFTANPQGRHRYLIFDPAQKDRVLKAFTELASARPVPRVPRFRQQQQQKKQADPPKAEEPKKAQ